MRRIVLIWTLMACWAGAAAQEVQTESLTADVASPVVGQPMGLSAAATTGSLRSTIPVLQADSLVLPQLGYDGTLTRYAQGNLYTGWGTWSLHPGLNGSLSAAAIFGLGKHGGSGFSQSVSLMYALPLSSRLSLAVGGYYSHLDWGGRSFSNAGLSAVLGYRFNEHWEGYIFGEKSIMTPKMPLALYDISELGDRIGAAVRYNFSPSFSIQMSVYEQRMPRFYVR
ncbi:MAG: hypothetical protein IJ710_09400 [Prevotella sp.]|nr:hypothetical protein [Prevotella sp.]